MFRFGINKPGRITLEDQLQVLARCGVAMLPDRTVEELLMSRERESYETEPFQLLITTLGNEVEGEPLGRLFSHDVWHFDSECIEGPGSYASIAERLSILAKGNLPIQDAWDHIDIDAGDASLEFELDGVSQRYEPVLEDDWVDPAIFGWFMSLLRHRSSSGMFTFLDLGGQDCVIGFASPLELKRLRRETGLNFQWFS